MFKLIKIVNSGVNVPEFVTLEKPSSLAVKPGSALVIHDGLAAFCIEDEIPTHISAEVTRENSDTVLCFEINGNMHFEVPLDSAPDGLNIGDLVSVSCDSDDCSVLVSPTVDYGQATVVDLQGATDEGDKITVKFK